MKLFRWTSLCLLGGLVMTAAATKAHADAWNKKTYITISQSIEVPGAVLTPGKYVFKLLDSPSNRHIVQIMNAEENHVYATNLAIPKQRMEPADKTILIFYEVRGGGPEPVRAWFYPGDTIGQEFAYPKKRAAEIALAVKQDVPVLAESRQPVEPVMGPPPADTSASSSAARTETEEATPEPEPQPPSPEAAAAEPAEPVAEQPQQPAAEPQPADTPAEPSMPRTAGYTATLGLAGLCCLGVAAALRRAAAPSGSKS